MVIAVAGMTGRTTIHWPWTLLLPRQVRMIRTWSAAINISSAKVRRDTVVADIINVIEAGHSERFFILSYTMFPRHPQQHPLTVLPPIPHSFETSISCLRFSHEVMIGSRIYWRRVFVTSERRLM
eukprot:scaffold2487_cov98-Skeletonema_dohrnii-CCMP3373.AAC.10